MDTDQLKPKQSLLSKRKSLEQDLEHISQEMYKRNKELADANRILSLLRAIDTIVLESREPLRELCKQLSDAIIKTTDNSFVAILVDQAGQSYHRDLEIFGWQVSEQYQNPDLTQLDRVKIPPNLPWLTGSDRSLFVKISSLTDDEIATYFGVPVPTVASLRHALPLQSMYAAKLMARQRLVGVIVVGFVEPIDHLDNLNTLLFERLAEAVGLAIDNKILSEENQSMLKQLTVTNQKLRDLDQTKDEFISMASHQLRTPLTSVKGYVSMVLEGDAGPINDQQKNLLNQAFISSQRMVYLIADLLNVSRLKTGKFIITWAPTQLADVIEGEISQLLETAKGRKLELTYQKPANFPSTPLDETKIRQVIMNFVDNAIYYTPAGGHINVQLVDKGEDIEFTVTDDGIGVPPGEQKNMFTKFYRAANAQKARPDGTGLGLFMAQKVIVAQGGAIIFHSEVGKGSTFGFTFNKAKLEELSKKSPAPVQTPIVPAGREKPAEADNKELKAETQGANRAITPQ